VLCTTANVKAQLGIPTADTTDDAVIARIAGEVSAAMARAAGRVCQGRPALERATWIERLSPERRTHVLHVAAYPITSVTEVIEALYGAFDDATALTADEDYQLERHRGRLFRVGFWMAGALTVRVTYEGGYTPAEAWVSGTSYAAGDRVTYGGAVYACTDAVSGATAPSDDEDHWEAKSLEVAVPDDLRGACIAQSVHEFTRRRSPGATSESAGSSSSASGGWQWLDRVADVIDGYRRRLL